MENETLIIPHNVWSDGQDRQHKINKLTELVFNSEGLKNMDNFFFKSGSIQTQKSISLKDHMLLCNLEITNYKTALGHPLDSTQSVILYDLTSWRGALDNDLVAVVLFDNTAKDVEKRYGKVVKIVKKGHKEKFVCRMKKHSTIYFNPIDKKAPSFVNLPKISRRFLNVRKKDIEGGHISQPWVVVFDESSLPFHKEDDLPTIKEIIPAETALNLLFVVRVIGWEPDTLLPLGAVVESLPLGTNLFHSERLLRAEHGIYEDDLDQELCRLEVEKVTKSLPSDVVCQAFTIDPSDARILDNALSLVQDSKNTYTMAVLISNVSQLKLGSDLDKRAQNRAIAVFGFFRNMIPDAVCQKFSLNPKQLRDVIIVSAKITLEKDGSVSIDTTDTSIKEGKLLSQVRLDYFEAQCLLSKCSMPGLQEKLDQYPCLPGQPDLALSLQLLYKMALHLRVKRLGQAAYSYNHFGEDVAWQAHLLVEEMMIWVNSTVAEYVYKHTPSYAVLRKQSAFNKHDLRELQRLYGDVIGHSVAMSSLGNNESMLQPLLIPHSTLCKIQEAIESKNAFQLQYLLTSDNLYPQLAAAADYLVAIHQRANYECGYWLYDEQTTTTSSLRHHSLCCDYYTHFNSPLRRYCDIVVQRLLLSILNQRKCDYTIEQLDDLCRHFNIRSQEAKKFEKAVAQLKFAHQLGESCEETHAYVYRNMNTFRVVFPEVKYKSCLDKQKAEFHISTLFCLGNDEVLQWKGNMFSFKGNDIILDNFHFCQVETSSSERATVPSITTTVFYKPIDEASLEMTDHHQKIRKTECDKLLKLQVSLVQTQNTIAIDPEEWQSVIQKVDNITNDDTLQQLSAAISKAQLQKLDKAAHTFEPTAVLRFRKSPIVRFKIRCRLGSDSIVSFWLGQNFLKESILSSCLQLMEVAPELRICLQHNKHPAECFADPLFSQASKSEYKSLEEYIFLWEKVFLAEAAQDSVLGTGNRYLNILKDVPLQWINSNGFCVCTKETWSLSSLSHSVFLIFW